MLFRTYISSSVEKSDIFEDYPRCSHCQAPKNSTSLHLRSNNNNNFIAFFHFAAAPVVFYFYYMKKSGQDTFLKSRKRVLQIWNDMRVNIAEFLILRILFLPRSASYKIWLLM